MAVALKSCAATVLSAAIVLNQTIALICQFIQHTDRIFPLLYFTVDSAAFVGGVAALALVRPTCRQLPALRAGSTVSVLLSALIFALVIAPASATGTWIQPWDDYWVRTATILFHGVSPILVTVEFVAHDLDRNGLRSILPRCFVWPMLYLVMLYGLSLSGVAHVPYPFLDLAQVGWWAVIGSIGVMALMILVLGTALVSINHRWHVGRV